MWITEFFHLFIAQIIDIISVPDKPTTLHPLSFFGDFMLLPYAVSERLFLIALLTVTPLLSHILSLYRIYKADKAAALSERMAFFLVTQICKPFLGC